MIEIDNENRPDNEIIQWNFSKAGTIGAKTSWYARFIESIFSVKTFSCKSNCSLCALHHTHFRGMQERFFRVILVSLLYIIGFVCRKQSVWLVL